jgi:hypothetical protein
MTIPASIQPTDTFEDWRLKNNEIIDTYAHVSVSGVNPTANDGTNAGYRQGSIWIQESSGQVFTCTDDTPGAAIWFQH